MAERRKMLRKTFISYRHHAHLKEKNIITNLNDKYELFIDKSVDSGDISDQYKDETIRQIIRDDKLKDSTVTLFIHGVGTDKRKFIDWELAGSMIDYQNSYQNAIIVIDTLGYAFSAANTTPSDVSDNISTFVTVNSEQRKSRDFWKSKLPYLPERLLINMTRPDVKINVIKLETIVSNPFKLRDLINKVAEDRKNNNYDTSLALRKNNG